MSAIALVGAVTIPLEDRTRERLILPLVAFSAGSLMGGAFLHMIPEAVKRSPANPWIYLWVLIGFTTFFVFEQFLHWHHWHADSSGRKSPLSHLMVIGDGLHKLLGGVAVAGAFIVGVPLGVTTWIVAAAHEVPQELGKYGVLLHGGWSKGQALVVSVASSLPFLVGGVFAYVASTQVDVTFLVPFHLPRAVRRRKLPLHRRLGPGAGGEQAPSDLDERAALRLLRRRHRAPRGHQASRGRLTGLSHRSPRGWRQGIRPTA